MEGRGEWLLETWRGVEGRCEAVPGREKLDLPTAAAAAAAAMLTFGELSESFRNSGRSE